MQNIKDLVTKALREIADAPSPAELEQLRIRYLGRKGELTGILRGLKNLVADERARLGQVANVAREQLLAAFTDAEQGLTKKQIEPIDVSLPGTALPVGHRHLVSQAIQDIARIFREVGFTRVRHPEIETEWFPFEALNVPGDHPARDEWETFFMDHPGEDGFRYVLTPHATSGSARALATMDLPVRAINIQKTYRRQIDASHTPMFHQFDGVWAGKGVTFQHLKGILEYFVKSYFGEDREIRIRPFHFRFTEPSFEVDISCGVCHARGCKLCKQGWVELGGAGMLHPNVLRAAKLDPKKVSAMAFGWGVERTLLMRAGLDIPDIRVLYENDVRFLEQF